MLGFILSFEMLIWSVFKRSYVQKCNDGKISLEETDAIIEKVGESNISQDSDAPPAWAQMKCFQFSPVDGSHFKEGDLDSDRK